MKLFGGVMAGGKGERFWPLSRESVPKQFLELFTGEPLIIDTYERLKTLVSEEEIVFITTKILEHPVKDLFPKSHVIVEPVGKNTAPAVLYTAFYIKEKVKDAVILMVPSDHVIKDRESFKLCAQFAINIASEGYLVTFGIPPTRPETGYGYIERESLILEDGRHRVFTVKKFHEKPDKKTAESYIKSGEFYWNSGMFVFTLEAILEAFKKHAPDIFKVFEENWPDIESIYERVKNISVDYAVMEKAPNIAVVEATFEWEDVGSFTSLERLFERDDWKNVKIGDAELIDSHDNIVVAQDGLVALIGVDGFVVVHTEDVTLVIRKEDAQRVKEIVEKLRKDKRKEKYIR